MNSNYVEIDLIDLCKTVLKKWKIILACALFCAILGGVYGYFQASKPKPESKSQIASLTSGMTQEEIDNVKDAAEIIGNYRTMYLAQKEYNENSIYQNLNPYSVDTLQLSYYIDNFYQVSYPVIEENNNLISIVQAYISTFSDDSLYKDVAKENGISDPSYVKELIVFDDTNYDSGVLTIRVYAGTDEMLKIIGDFVKTTIANKEKDIEELCGPHKITLTAEAISKTVDLTMAEQQSLNVERLTKLSTNMINEEKMFSGNQLVYLRSLVHEYSISEDSVSLPKYVITGMLLGALISALYFVIAYILNGNIKTEYDAIKTLKTTSFGDYDLGADFLASKINNDAETRTCKKIAFVCKTIDENIEKLSSLVKAETICLSDILSNKKDFEMLATCDAAVFIVELQSSNRKEALKMKAMCEKVNVKVLGVIVK